MGIFYSFMKVYSGCEKMNFTKIKWKTVNGIAIFIACNFYKSLAWIWSLIIYFLGKVGLEVEFISWYFIVTFFKGGSKFEIEILHEIPKPY